MAVLNSANSVQLWPTGSDPWVGTPNPNLVLQDDGNLVLYGSTGGVSTAIWATDSVSTIVTGCTASSPSTISAGAIIASGGCLQSPNHQYQLRMQTDGNLVLYYQSQNAPLWNTNTATSPGAQFRLWSNGTMAVQAPGNVYPWSIAQAAPSAVLALQDNGNLQEFGNNSTPLMPVMPYSAWQTVTTNLRGNSLPSGTTLSPGQYLMSQGGTYKLSMGTNGLLELS
jgi:hypothetical protein